MTPILPLPLVGDGKLKACRLSRGSGAPVRDRYQLELVDGAVHHGIVGKESDDLHRAAALRADYRINFIGFADHLDPALGGDRPELPLNHS